MTATSPRSRHRPAVVMIIAVATALWHAPAAQAQESTKDATASSRLAKELSTLKGVSKILDNVVTVEQNLGRTENAIRQGYGALGAISGEASISSITSGLQMGLSSVGATATNGIMSVMTNQQAGAANLDELAPIQIFGAISQDLSIASSSIPSLNTAISGINTALSGTMSGNDSYGSLQKNLYVTDPHPTAAETETVSNARRALVANQIGVSMTQADAIAQAETNNGPKALQVLNTQRKAATTVRGAAQANTTQMIKLIDEQRTTNLMLARLAQLQAATSIAAQPANSPTNDYGPNNAYAPTSP